MELNEYLVSTTGEFISTPFRTILNAEYIGVKGFTTFGHAVNNKAELPLIDHFHKNRLEFVVVVKGMQRFKASDREHVLYTGEAFYTLANEIHSTFQSTNQSNELLWFQLDLANRENFLDLPYEKAIAMHDTLSNYKLRKTELPNHIIEGLLEAFNLFTGTKINDKIKGYSVFLYSLLEMLALQENDHTVSDDVSRVKQYIADHLKEQITIDELLLGTGLTASDLKEKFKTETGLSYRDYIHKIKIEKACYEVAMTDKNIADIAFEYGFATVAHFKSTFKNFAGLSPRVYKKKYLQGKIDL